MKGSPKQIFIGGAVVCALALASVSPAPSLAAATTTDTSAIQSQISAHTQQISSIQKDIDAYTKQLNTLGTQKQTLQSNIKSIDVTKQKTVAQITQTQTKIQTVSLQLDQLGVQITTKQQAMDLEKQTLAASLRQIQNDDQVPLIAALFSSDTLTDAWQTVDTQSQLNTALQTHSQQLASVAEQLSDQKSQVSSTKNQLVSFTNDLTTQKGQLDATEKSKQQLLTQTKSQESSYQTLLAQKKKQEQQFESELSELENSLKGVSASEIPHTGQGIVSWPFSATVMNNCKGKQSALGNPYCITQYFGNTPFATANSAIYSGMGHDGIDIGVPIGTPVEAALSGVVAGTGNTDLVVGCYSFGKWVMIKHANGLNTMYAHLSQINVSKGQSLSTGDVLGYSGMTGYATGPHLHFGVYATAGVQYLTLNQFRGAKTPCANAQMPVAPKDAYLNPLSYL